MKVEWFCPFCGVENTTYFATWNIDKCMLVPCDTEEGGCGSTVSIKPKVVISAEVKRVKYNRKGENNGNKV